MKNSFLAKASVPLMFILICAFCIPIAGLSPSYLANEIVTRMGRNSFLILSLLIPIMAGMGLNFGMTLGAMAGEIGLILVSDWQIVGIPGMVLAAIISVPISILLGVFCGKILNKAKGREMITSYIMSFFINGIYQLVVLYLMGSVIPIKHSSIKLPRGYGIRNTVSLLRMRQHLDNLVAIKIGGIKIPVVTFIIIGLLCLFIIWFRRTKLGQDMRAVGQDMEVARDAGINVERTRIISIVMSTVLAGFGMIIYLQNMGNIATYSSHSQIGMFCIAALLVGGASVDRASIGNVFLGVILFHTMFIVAPRAGAYITGDSMIGEYFRVFVSYAVITVALVMYETSKRKAKSAAGEQLAKAQELRLRIVLHAAVQPVDDTAEAFALVGMDDDLPIPRANVHALGGMIYELRHDVFANLHQASLKHLPVRRIVDMVYGLSMLDAQLHGRVKAFLHGGYRRILPHDAVDLLQHDSIDQCRYILEMIVKSISIDAAVLHNISHGDFVERTFVQQFEQRFHDGASLSGCHVAIPPLLTCRSTSPESRLAGK